MKNIFLFFLFLYISLGLYCASKSGWLPLVHGPYYFSIAQSLFYNNEISQYAIYPPVQSLVYTLQIGISYFEYLIFFISERHWYIIFYSVTSLVWVTVFIEFLKLNIKFLNKIDKYLIFSIFFLQPYNLNQLSNFSNEALYFPVLLFFFLSFFRLSTSENYNKFYWFIFAFFIIFGVYFRLHHAILCVSFFIFSLLLKNKKITIYLTILGLLTISIFFLIVQKTYLNTVFFDHYNYFNKSISAYENYDLKEGLIYIIDRFFIVITYPLLLTKFTAQMYIVYIAGFLILYFIFEGFKIINKTNKSLNLYLIIYLILSIIFVLYLPPFEYSYILPFSFVIFLYLYIGFKKTIPKFYIIFLKFSFVLSFFIIIFSYFFFNTVLIEGHNYRKFINDLKKQYIFEKQDLGVFYLAQDAHDHFEDFYWQNKNKRPFCQLLKVSIEKCVSVQDKDNDIFIYIIGKNIQNLSNEFGYKSIEEFDLDKDIYPLIESITSYFNRNKEEKYNLDRFYKSEFSYHILLRKESYTGQVR